MSKARKPARHSPPPVGDESSPPRRLPIWKKGVFALLTTVAFFAALEGLLLAVGIQPTAADRDPFVGFQASIPLYIPQQRDDGTVVMRTAPNKLAFFNDQSFPRQKADDTVRIFCLGGSTVYGHPYDDATSFAGWLRELLPAADAGQQWEVINAGGISYASYRVAALMDQLVDYQPDLFIVLTGHNEFLEQRTYGAVRQMPAPLRAAAATLSRTRTYTVLQGALRGRSSMDATRRPLLPAEVDAILDHTVGPSSYHRDDQLRQRVLDHMAYNLDRMVDIATAAGAEIIFVTPAVNLKDFSPFKSEHDRQLDASQRQAFAERFAEAELLEQQGDPTGALAAYQAAAAIDPRVAEVHFRIGQVLFAQSQFDQARAALQRAIDEDVCPLRATLAIQQLVQRAAIGRGTPLVDFDAILQHDCHERFGHRCPGAEYFLDHVHPDIATHRLLALGMIDALAQTGIVRIGPAWTDEAVATASQRIMQRVDPLRHARALGTLAQVLSWAGKKEEAGQIAIQAVELRSSAELPDDAEMLYLAAVQYVANGAAQQAIPLLQKVVQRQPDNGGAHWRLGLLLYEAGATEQAMSAFQQAARINPADAQVQQMIGALHAAAGQLTEALRAFDIAYQQNPSDPHLQYDIAVVHQRMGNHDQALRWYAQALKDIDDPFPVHRNLAQLLQQQGRTADAIEHLEQAQRLRPDAAEIRQQLSALRGP